MNKYKIKSVQPGLFWTEVVTNDGKKMDLPCGVIKNMHGGDVVCEYMSRGLFKRVPLAYSCGANFVLVHVPRNDKCVRHYGRDYLSRIERWRFNVGMIRALHAQGITPSVSFENNMRMLLANQRVNTL